MSNLIVGEQKELHKEAGVSSLRPTDGKIQDIKTFEVPFNI